MSEPAATTSKPPVDERTVKRAVWASAMGNATEWYDYGVFTSGAIATSIGTLFFPGEGNAVLKSLALLAVGFIVRPFGGAFFGPLGDKIGRKRVLAVTILLMSGCTFLVGVLPTYAGGYSMGIAAPIAILLLRIIQGFSTGGEYGGAATFIAEYSPTKRRGFFGSFLELGTLGGYVLGNLVVLSVTLSLSADQVDAWGWRIPFFVALPLGLIGLYLRNKLEDTPEFRRMEAAGEAPKKAPLKEIFSRNWRMILNLIGIVLLLNVADYLLLTTMPTYFTDTLKINDNTSTLIIIAVEVIQMAIIVPLGALSDRIGRKPLLLTAAIGFLVLSWPSLKLMQSGSILWLFVGFLVVAILLVLHAGRDRLDVPGDVPDAGALRLVRDRLQHLDVAVRRHVRRHRDGADQEHRQRGLAGVLPDGGGADRDHPDHQDPRDVAGADGRDRHRGQRRQADLRGRSTLSGPRIAVCPARITGRGTRAPGVSSLRSEE